MEREKKYQIADNYEGGIIICRLKDKKADLMSKGKSTDAIGDLIVKVGIAPQEKIQSDRRER